MTLCNKDMKNSAILNLCFLLLNFFLNGIYLMTKQGI